MVQDYGFRKNSKEIEGSGQFENRRAAIIFSPM